MPSSTGARLDEARAALASLRAEERRLQRLGLGEPLRRCREQLRYWEFLAAVFSLEKAPRKRLRRAGGGH
jgi:hypothetical protein